MTEKPGAKWFKKLLPTFFLLGAGLYLSFSHGLERWDRFIYDFLTKSTTRPPAEDIVIIAIDEVSLAQFGRWPWPRSLHAGLIDKLSLGGAKAIGFDIIISEPDLQAGEDDLLLAEAVARSGKVFMPVLGEMNQLDNAMQLTKPIPPLAAAAAGLGHVDFELDSDGIQRRTFLKAGLGGADYPSLALAMLAFVDPGRGEGLPGRRNERLKLADPDNWVRDHEILMPFGGGPDHFRRISYGTFIDPGFDPTIVDGCYVFVGATAIGLGDALPTPVSGESVPMPGVEINANLLDALTRNKVIEPMSTLSRSMLTGLLILAALVLYPLLNARLVQLMLLSSLGLVITVSCLLLVKVHIWFPPGPALLALVISYPLWTWRQLGELVEKLFKEKEQALVTLHSIADGVITTSIDGHVKYMNPVAETLTGFSNNEAGGLELKDVLPITDESKGRDQTKIVDECLAESAIIQLPEEVLFVDKSGVEHAARVSAGPLKDKQGNFLGVVLGVTDVTEKRHALLELSYRTTHDILTGLPNRSLLSDRLRQGIARAHGTGKPVGVLFINLSNFKKVNDQVGHSGGDLLLQEVTKRLKTVCRDGDTLARPGSDEFVLVLEALTDEKAAAMVADRCNRLLELPFMVAGHEIFLGGAIGISVFPKDGKSVETLIKSAGTAMFEVKKQGRGGYLYFSTEMNRQIQERLQLETRLRNALSNNEFELYYQPQVRLRDGRITGVEALVRWRPEGEEIILPSAFITMAEETGLILPLSLWIISSACRQLKKWEDELDDPVAISVNISPRHFQDDNLPQQLGQIINDAGIDPRHLELEITEGVIMKNVERSREILKSFQLLGGKVAIDDFGAGYSSFAYLKKFSFNKLKIDRSFIKDIDKNTKDKGLAKTMITMGHGLGLSVVAEGVNSREQVAILTEQDCDIVQGFYFSEPLPEGAMTRLLKTSRHLTAGNIAADLPGVG